MPSISQSDRQDKKEIIRHAAIEVIAEKGFHSSTTDMIAKTAGVSVGTIYNYFRSKEAILSHIFQVELDKRIRWLEELHESNLPTRLALEEFFRRHCQDLTELPNVARILMRERSFAREHDPKALQSYMQRIPDAIAALLKRGQVRGEVQSAFNPNFAAAALFGAMDGVMDTLVEEPKHISLPTLYTQLIDMVWNGLVAH